MTQVELRPSQRNHGRLPSTSLVLRVSGRLGQLVFTAALILLATIWTGNPSTAYGIQPAESLVKTESPEASSAKSELGAKAADLTPSPYPKLATEAKPGPQSTPATAQASAAPGRPSIDRSTVISYLGRLISWYRQVQTEQRLATEPAETLFAAEDRQNATRILELGFEYADAVAKILDSKTPVSTTTVPANSAVNSLGASAASLSNLLARRAEAHDATETASSNVLHLKAKLRRARPTQREVIANQIGAAEAELALAQSQTDAISALINFESGSGGAGSDLQAQIDQLKATVTDSSDRRRGLPLGTSIAETRPLDSVRVTAPASGIFAQAENLLALSQKSQELDNTLQLTNHLLAAAEQLREPLRDDTRRINQRMLELAASTTSNNLTIVKDAQSQAAKLASEHKLVVAAMLPLSMQTMVLMQYIASLERWQSTVAQRSRAALSSLLLRLSILLVILFSIVGSAALWRRFAFRYVHDPHRRHQVIKLSRIIVAAIIALVLLFDFADELGALATVMGFAAAGIALTLQNVILSIAGYFYISGRYGIRVGDRVQISGVSGDVIEIGLFKMTLIELGNDDGGHQPTGRVTVFPNSVVFQPNGSFAKQLPGSDFTWNELRLSLAPECDFRLAERRLIKIVRDVFGSYRDALQRQYRGLERNLNQSIEPLQPQSRLRVSEAGIELVIRYPVQLKLVTQTADEIARRVVDALKHEPSLRLVTPGTPMIQSAETAHVEEPAAADLNGDLSTRDSFSAIDNSSAATAAAAAAGATVAGAIIETSASAQEREGLPMPREGSHKS